MESTVITVAIVAALLLWHRRNRRHPGWQASDAGRFYIFCGYALVAIAAFWLHTAPTATTWEWAFGNLWALAAMVAFVWGFDSLSRTTARHAEMAQEFETIAPAERIANAAE